MDLGTLLGICMGLAAIMAGFSYEGGSIIQILQPTAAMIVFGGTLGATLISFPMATFKRSLADLIHLFRDSENEPNGVIDDMVRFSHKARREGIISLEKDAESIQDPFFKKAITMALDGTDPRELRQAMECELQNMDERGEHSARVLEAAGGFAPTIGIIGAVLGLIQVMQHLDNISEVGSGIAVAFVATIYGVACANVFLLPAAAKLKFKHRQIIIVKEMMLEGVLGIIQGENPRLIEGKMMSFMEEKYQRLRETVKKSRTRRVA
jgi:chemotaxis protein MotA